MPYFISYSIQPFSFFIGLFTGLVLAFLISKARPLWDEARTNLREQREASQARRSTGIEENHRRITLRRAQGMHLAAPLFALDEILQQPLVLAPPSIISPGEAYTSEDTISQTLPYLPMWTEMASIYNAQTLTLPQAISKQSNLILIGQLGIGKTVALAHLASLAANRSELLGEQKDLVPFLLHVAELKIPINDPKSVLNPIVDAVSEFAPIMDLGRFPGFTQIIFQTGRAMLLVDGMDELPPAGQQLVSDYFKILIQAYPKTKIITTGTPDYVDGLISLGFTPLGLMTWKSADKDQFIQRWGELWNQTVALEAWAQTGPKQVDPILLNTWLATDNIHLNPFELTLKVWGAYAGDTLGPQVTESIATHIRRISPSNIPIAALEALAMQVILTTQPIFDSYKGSEWVKSFEPAEEKPANADAETIISKDGSEEKTPAKKKNEKKSAVPSFGLIGKLIASGLLSSHEGNRIRFAHPIFGGYLAGRALSSYGADDTILNQPDWAGKHLALNYMAMYGDASSIVQKMLEWSRLPMHRPLLVAARWLRDAPRNTPWRGKLMATLASILQMNALPLALRAQVISAFIASNDQSVATLFRQLLISNSPELVQLGALGCGAVYDSKSISALSNVLDTPNISSRRAACMALVAIGTNEALEVVAHALLNGDEDLRRAAAEALANDRQEGHAMLNDGSSMQDIMVRRSVVFGLARIPEAWATEILVKMQTEDDQWIVRNVATEVVASQSVPNSRIPRKLKPPSESPWLIEFAGKQGVGISPGAPATDLLLLALKGDDPDLRLAALPYLKFTPTEGVINGIYNAMYRDDPELREYAYNILWEIGISGAKLPDPVQFGLG